MRILVANSIQSVEETSDLATCIERACSALLKQGHRIDRFTLPFVHDISSLLEQAMSYRLLDVMDSADRLITFDFPACLLRHPNKVIVISNRFDCFQDSSSSSGFNSMQRSVVRRIRQAIQASLVEAKAIFCENQAASAELQRHGLDIVSPHTLLSERLNDQELAEQLASAVHPTSGIRMDGQKKGERI